MNNVKGIKKRHNVQGIQGIKKHVVQWDKRDIVHGIIKSY